MGQREGGEGLIGAIHQMMLVSLKTSTKKMQRETKMLHHRQIYESFYLQFEISNTWDSLIPEGTSLKTTHSEGLFLWMVI